MPKNRKIQPAVPKMPCTETPPISVEVEDEITAPEAVDAENSTGTPTLATYVVSDAEAASGASSVEEDTFLTPLPVPVVPAPRGKTPSSSPAASSSEQAPRLVDAANLLFNPPPRTINSDVARGRGCLLYTSPSPRD